MAFSLNIRHFDVFADSLLPGEACFLNACLATEAAASDKLTLNIPFWQRDYDWGEKQITSFLASLSKAAAEERPLFLGALVLCRHLSFPDKFLIVDGQQRLRTIQTFIDRWRSFFPGDSDSRVLPLMRGVGESEKRLQSHAEIEAGLNSDAQRSAFEEKRLAALKLNQMPASAWLSRIRFRIVLVDYSFSPEKGVTVDPFDSQMSTLFSRLNRQAKPLDDIDVLKAKLLFECRQLGLEGAASALARNWEKARMLQLVPTVLADESLLASAILEPAEAHETKLNPLEIIPYDPEVTRLQFSRFLLLTAAIAREDDPPSPSREDLLSNGWLLKHFKENSLLADEEDELQANLRNQLTCFGEKLGNVTDAFIQNRTWLMIARRNCLDFEDAERIGKVPLSAMARRLLFFQSYVSAGTSSSRAWLVSPVLTRLLRETIQAGGALTEEDLSRILASTEAFFFKTAMASNAGEHTQLTARDWFLWRALFDAPEGNRCFDIACEGMNELLAADKGHFEEETGAALLARMRTFLAQTAPNSLPTTTGAAEVEHFVALDRGIRKENTEPYESLANKAHIANGLNQSIRNDPILKKAGQLDRSWWPTLQFLAAYAKCGRNWKVAETPLDVDCMRHFVEPLEKFWAFVAGELGVETESRE